IFLSSHILPEVEQIADHVIIINRGKMVRSGRLQDLLSTGGQVEILADRIPDAWNHNPPPKVSVLPRGQAVAVIVDNARKREIVETLWTAGCDVISINPLRSTLEELFLKEVEPNGGSR